MVSNVHERLIRAPLSLVGGLIDRLGSREDALWPGDRWPAMRFSGPLGVGAKGGHGFVRYTVESYEPGQSILFRFTGPPGFIGTHGFDAEETSPGVVRLRHALKVDLQGAARISWPLVIRWLHDALIEDALDRAEGFAKGENVRPREWSMWVKFLRRLARPSVASRSRKESSASRKLRHS